MRSWYLLFLLLYTVLAFGQDTTDAFRLSKMSYMEIPYAQTINCDSTPSDNLSHRICLNWAFQQADAVMNALFIKLLEQQENDSLRQEMVIYQQAWVAHRRRHSHSAADGYRGHLLGIIYLDHMLQMTRMRKEELDYLFREE